MYTRHRIPLSVPRRERISLRRALRQRARTELRGLVRLVFIVLAPLLRPLHKALFGLMAGNPD